MSRFDARFTSMVRSTSTTPTVAEEGAEHEAPPPAASAGPQITLGARAVLSSNGKDAIKEWATGGEGAAIIKSAAYSALQAFAGGMTQTLATTEMNMNALHADVEQEVLRLKERVRVLEAAEAERKETAKSDAEFDRKYFYPLASTRPPGTATPWTSMQHALSGDETREAEAAARIETLLASVHASPPRRTLLGKRPQPEDAGGAFGGLPGGLPPRVDLSKAAAVSPMRPTPRRAANGTFSPAIVSPPQPGARLGGRSVRARTSVWSDRPEKGHPIFQVTTTWDSARGEEEDEEHASM